MADIVTISEFSVLNYKTGKGSRGSTFKKYVLDYMSRENAVENLGPVGLVSDPEKYIDWMDSLPEDGKIVEGAAFDDSHISMKISEIEETADCIQRHFRQGKTIFKTVISFDPDYLKKLQVCPSDLQIVRKGDYYGKTDMLKLRMAIQNGMQQFSCGFDQLKWIGVIQADTLHVHCHLCMVDEGPGVLHHSGQQRGKAPEIFFDRLKAGIAQELERTAGLSVWYRDLQAMPEINREKGKEIQPEQEWFSRVLRLLPENTALWIAPTNDPRMKPASDLFEAGLRETLKRESGLSEDVKNRKTFLFEIMNESYKTIAAGHPKPSKQKTAGKLPNIEFGIRQPESETDDRLTRQMRRHRRRQQRKNRHEQKAMQYQTRLAGLNTAAMPGLSVLQRYYQTERDYHAQAFRKYDALCGNEIPEDLFEQASEIDRLKAHLQLLRTLNQDSRFERLSPEEGSVYAFEQYGIQNGDHYRRHPEKLLEDIEDAAMRLQKSEETLQYRLQIRDLIRTDDGQFKKKPSSASLSDLALIDAHEMGEDEKSEQMARRPGAWKTFREWAQKRYEALRSAWPFLQKIHRDKDEQETRQDIEQMMETARQDFRAGYKSRLAERARFQHLDAEQVRDLQKQLTEQMQAWVYQWSPSDQRVAETVAETVAERSHPEMPNQPIAEQKPAPKPQGEITEIPNEPEVNTVHSPAEPETIKQPFSGFDNISATRSEKQNGFQR